MEEVNDFAERIGGLGPTVPAQSGRGGGSYTRFSDYAVALFRKAVGGDGKTGARPLFDVGAVAMIKNSGWAKSQIIAAPQIVGNAWKERPEMTRKVTLWKGFSKDGVVNDYYKSVRAHNSK